MKEERKRGNEICKADEESKWQKYGKGWETGIALLLLLLLKEGMSIKQVGLRIILVYA